jgi:hypothetical protein
VLKPEDRIINRLRVFEKKMLRSLFSPERNLVILVFKKTPIIGLIKSRNSRLVGNVACRLMRRWEVYMKLQSENKKRTEGLEDLIINGRKGS